jgi:hypothetical protein
MNLKRILFGLGRKPKQKQFSAEEYNKQKQALEEKQAIAESLKKEHENKIKQK